MIGKLSIKIDSLRASDSGEIVTFKGKSHKMFYEKFIKEHDIDSRIKNESSWYFINFIADLRSLFEFVFTSGLDSDSLSIIIYDVSMGVRSLDEMKESIESLKINDLVDKLNKVKLIQDSNHLNEKCNVHIHDIGMLTMTKTKLIVDGCTELLQRHLNEGWRIIAICPQPDQRRPDYILGMK